MGAFPVGRQGRLLYSRQLIVLLCLSPLSPLTRAQDAAQAKAQAPSQEQAPAPAPSQGTNAADTAVLLSLRNHFSFTAAQIDQLRWDGRSDVCGVATCGVGSCSWNGIACSNWRVVGFDISQAVVSTQPQPVAGTLSPGLANLTNLRYLDVSGQRIGGSLPPEWGSLSFLARLNVSSNALTGPLPAGWQGMTSIVVMDLSRNRFTGAVPQTWAQLSSLRVLDVTNNSVCRSSLLPNSIDIRNDSPTLCTSTQLFAANSPLAAPMSSVAAASRLSSPPYLAPQAPAPPPPASTAGAFGSSPQPILQMSTGINIAVSVVIGAFLLFGIIAGAIRVRRQQNAHASWLRSRAEALWRQEREEDEAFRRHLKQLRDPNLVVDPAGDVISLAVPLKPTPRNDDDDDHNTSPGGSTGNPGGGSAEAVNGSTATEEPATEAETEGGEAASEETRTGSQPATGEGPGPAPAPRESWRSSRPFQLRRPHRRLPMFVIDVYVTPGGSITFGEGETHWADEARNAEKVQSASDVPAAPAAVDSTVPASGASGGIGGGIRSLFSLRSKKESADPLDRTAAPAAAVLQPLPPASRPQSFTTQQQQGGDPAPPLPAVHSTTTTQDPSVAARVRERIDELREPETAAPARNEGPAPPPPFIRWEPLRRALGMEDTATRDARLRREASRVARQPSVSGNAGAAV